MAALDTYDKLETEIKSWLNRVGFTDLEAQIPLFVEMGSRMIQKEDLNAMETIFPTFDLSGRAQPVPDDYDRTKTMTVLQGQTHFEINGATYKKVVQAGQNGRPLYYSTIGSDFIFGPIPDQSYTIELVYYAKLPVPSPTVATNWVLENEPDMLLWASLVSAAKWLKDDARLAVWQTSYQDVIQSLLASESRMDQEGGSLQVREQISRYQGSNKHY